MSLPLPAARALDPALLASAEFCELSQAYRSAFSLAAKEIARLEQATAMAQSLADLGASSYARDLMKAAGSENGESLAAPLSRMFQALAPAYVFCARAVGQAGANAGASSEACELATGALQEECLALLPAHIAPQARVIFEAAALTLSSEQASAPAGPPRKRPSL